MQNSLSNAIKFSPNEKTVTIKVEPDDDFILFQVIDEGIGIPKDQQNLIFEPFNMVDATDTRNHGGMGLGLAISKKLIALLEGSIELTSEPGQGTVFFLRIPWEKNNRKSNQ